MFYIWSICLFVFIYMIIICMCIYGQARLLEHKNLGVVTSVMSLLIGLASKSPGNYEGLVPHVIALLTRLVRVEKCFMF